MQVGDLVKTKEAGFGVGPRALVGVVVEDFHRQYEKEFKVLEPDGSMRTWYGWQLEVINESR